MPTDAGPITITDETVIEAHDLALRKERNDEWYVGREDLGSFVALPEIWAQAVIFMATRNPFTERYPSFAAVKAFIRAKSRGDEEFHAELDREVRILVSQLVRHRLVRAIGETVIEELGEKRDLLPSIKKRHVAWFFRPRALVVQAVIATVGLVVLAFDPAVRPHLSHYFWSQHAGLVVLSSFVSAWLLTMQHEMFHVLSARAYSLSGTLSFSTRGPSLIVEANIHNLPKAHAWVRRLVYGAGMLSDLLVTALAALLVAGFAHGVLLAPPWVEGVLRQLLLLRLIGLLWQGVLVFRTDVTSLLQVWGGDPNLHRKAIGWLRELWHHVRHPIPRDGPIHREQRQWPIATPAVRRFAAVQVLVSLACGAALLACKWVLITGLVRLAGAELGAGVRGDAWALADALVVFALLGWMLALFARTRVRARAAHAAGIA